MLYDYGREYWNTVRLSLRELDACKRAVANALARPAAWKEERRGLIAKIQRLEREVRKLVRRPGCVRGSHPGQLEAPGCCQHAKGCS